MFWGCKIKDNLPYALNVNGECILNISQICLKEQYSKGKILVNISSKEQEFTIAILQKDYNDYQSINLLLNLNKNEQQRIFITGAKGEVHLTGCIMLKYRSQLNKERIEPRKAKPIKAVEDNRKETPQKTKEEEANVKAKAKIRTTEEKGTDKKIMEDDSDIDINEIDYLLKKRKRSLSK